MRVRTKVAFPLVVVAAYLVSVDLGNVVLVCGGLGWIAAEILERRDCRRNDTCTPV